MSIKSTLALILFILLWTSTLLANPNEINLPPVPATSANSKTLLGVDSNKNGVRDDVEIYIYTNISKDPTIFKAYLLFAQSLQESFSYPDDVEKLRLNNDRNFNDQMCVHTVDVNWKKERTTAVGSIVKIIYNTPERKKVAGIIGDKYHVFGSARQVRKYKKQEVCRF